MLKHVQAYTDDKIYNYNYDNLKSMTNLFMYHSLLDSKIQLLEASKAADFFSLYIFHASAMKVINTRTVAITMLAIGLKEAEFHTKSMRYIKPRT